jgi:hypothetical protein
MATVVATSCCQQWQLRLQARLEECVAHKVAYATALRERTPTGAHQAALAEASTALTAELDAAYLAALSLLDTDYPVGRALLLQVLLQWGDVKTAKVLPSSSSSSGVRVAVELEEVAVKLAGTKAAHNHQYLHHALSTTLLDATQAQWCARLCSSLTAAAQHAAARAKVVRTAWGDVLLRAGCAH